VHSPHYRRQDRQRRIDCYAERHVRRQAGLPEKVETHKATLQLALEETNRKYAEYEAKQRTEAERKHREEETHEQRVREAAKKIKFD
jgi:hypothetical protein